MPKHDTVCESQPHLPSSILFKRQVSKGGRGRRHTGQTVRRKQTVAARNNSSRHTMVGALKQMSQALRIITKEAQHAGFDRCIETLVFADAGPVCKIGRKTAGKLVEYQSLHRAMTPTAHTTWTQRSYRWTDNRGPELSAGPAASAEMASWNIKARSAYLGRRATD